MSLSTKDLGLCIRAVEHQGAKYAISFLTFHNEINNIFFFVRKFFFFVLSRAWVKEKILIRHEESKLRSSNFIQHASCILLRLVMSIMSCLYIG